MNAGLAQEDFPTGDNAAVIAGLMSALRLPKDATIEDIETKLVGLRGERTVLSHKKDGPCDFRFWWKRESVWLENSKNYHLAVAIYDHDELSFREIGRESFDNEDTPAETIRSQVTRLNTSLSALQAPPLWRTEADTVIRDK